MIETERLLLRPLSESDAADVFEWVSDPVVTRYMPYPTYTDAENVKKWIRSIDPEHNEFGFVLKETGKVIGAGSVCPAGENGEYELGYNLNRAYWNNGYATEAAKAMIEWAHREKGVKRFFARHAVANTASGRVIEKCGFTYLRLVSYSRFDGSEIEAKYYELNFDGN